jgi:hypothetical protein
MKYAVDSESIQAYRTRVFVFSQELRRETDPSIRAKTAAYLAEASATLARLEVEEAEKARKATMNES